MDRTSTAPTATADPGQGPALLPLRPAPVGTAGPAAMTDDDIAAEITALTAYQYVDDVVRHPDSNRQLMSEIAPRRSALTRERDQRMHRRREEERAQREAQERRARLVRTSLGRRRADGRYPVFVDGRERGEAWKGSRSWWRSVDGGEFPDPAGARWEAVERIVITVDVRAAEARREAERSAAPAGWVAGGCWRSLERLDVVRIPGGTSGPAWGRAWRVTGREEHAGGRVSFRLEPADQDGYGVVLFGEDLGRFVRPDAETLAALPPVPFRLRHPAEHEARRLLQLSDELACLSGRPGAGAAAGEALELLARVEDGSSPDPGADMRRIAALAVELRRIVADPDIRDWRTWDFDVRQAKTAEANAEWAAERFEEGGGALTEEYRETIPH